MPNPKWTPADQIALVDQLAAMTGSKSAKFFGAHGLSEAYRQPGAGASKESKIVSALDAAARMGRLQDVLTAAWEFLQDDTPGHVDIDGFGRTSGAIQDRTKEFEPLVTSDRVVFISHAYKERAVARLLQQALNLAGVPNNKLFLSSTRSTGVPTGKDVLSELREGLDRAKLVIELVSTVFLTRPMCVMEFGAAWAMKKEVFPIVLPPLTREDAGRQLANLQMHQLLSDDDIEDMLGDLHDAVQQATGIAISHPDWRTASKHFKTNLTAALATAAAPSALRGSTPGSAGTTRVSAPPSTALLRAAGLRPKRIVRSVSTPKPVLGTRPDGQDDEDDSGLIPATDALRAALRPLNRQTRRVVLHASTWREEYRPEEGEEMAAAEKLLEVEWDEDSGGWSPRESHRAVGLACKAVRRWIKAVETCSEREADIYFNEYKVNELEPRSHELWDKLGLISA